LIASLSLNLDPNIDALYLRIANALRCAIQLGQLKPGEKLPSARKLALQLQTNRHTVMAAYQELIAQSWVESVERKGYKVAHLLPIETSRNLKLDFDKNEKQFQWQIKALSINNPPQKLAHEYQYNFAGGMPDIDLFPFKEFKSYMGESLSRPDIEQLCYGNNRGTEHFIEQVATYLRRVRSIKDKEIIAVNGSQEALFIVSQLLLKPGDNIAVESLGYRPAWQAFRSAGANILAIERNDQGIDFKKLTLLFESSSLKFIYLTPLHQYPTTVTIPVHERMKLYALAAKHNVAIIEDDYDHEFHYTSQPLAPIASDDPLGLVIYLATFSKIMFPGCRIGVMAVDKALLPAILNFRTLMNHKPNVVIQDAIARWMRGGAFERHVRKMSKLYHQRRDNLIELLSKYKQRGLDVDYHLPAGGMALWLDIKGYAEELEHYCQQHNVYLLSEKHFHLQANNNENRFIRIGFAGLSEEKLAEGLAIVFDYLIKKQRQ